MNSISHATALAVDRPSGLVRASLLQKLGGYVNTQLIYLFAKLGVADLLTTGAASSRSLASRLDLPHDPLHRLARGWISAGLLMETPTGDFMATPLAALLESDRPDSLREYAILTGEEWYPAWNGLLQAVEANDTPFDVVFGSDYYTYLSQKEEAGARFNRFMEVRTLQTVQALLATYDFSAARVIVDIGGGNGTLLQAVLSAHPHLHAILFEQPAVIREAEQRAAIQPFGERWQFVEGDFFTDAPPPGDLYILSQVLHNWGDEECGQILRSCRKSLQPQGALLILEQVIPAQIQANQSAVEADLMMLMLLKGRERTAAEYTGLLHSAEFAVTALYPLKRLGFTLLEAKIQTEKDTSYGHS